MQKRKFIKTEDDTHDRSRSKQVCSAQSKNEARQKILDERKERNRISAALSRKRKDDEIITLREQVKQLAKSNTILMNIIMNIPQSHDTLSEVGLNPALIDSRFVSNSPDNSNSIPFQLSSHDTDVSSPLFFPNSSKPAVFHQQ